MPDFTSTLSKLEDKAHSLEGDKEKLIRDNVTLIRENEYLKEHIEVTIREEQDKLMTFHQEKQLKQ